jgi:prepilin-type N-terminal cleavage/methylation domain-containing protein
MQNHLFKKQKKAFTLVELLIVIGLLVIIAFFSLDFLLDTSSRYSVDNTADSILQFFKKVQNQNQLYGIQGFSTDDQTYYGIVFKRGSGNTSSYFSYKKINTDILETFSLSNFLYFSNIAENTTTNIHFCANMNFELPVDPFVSSDSLSYLCDNSGILICDTNYTITIKSRMNGYEKTVIINTDKDDYGCKPVIYIQE